MFVRSVRATDVGFCTNVARLALRMTRGSLCSSERRRSSTLANVTKVSKMWFPERMAMSSMRSVRMSAGALVLAALFGACGGKLVVIGTEPAGAGGATSGPASGAGGAVGCPEGLLDCQELCVDARFDPKNCGACGVSCPEGELCSNGVCGVACGMGVASCVDALGETRCVDTLSSFANCGGCGKACAVGEGCLAGKCELACGGGSVACGAICTNFQFDPLNCGACGKACMVGANSVAVCAAGKCGSECTDGYGDCNLKVADGCETALMGSVTNCGACSNACAVVNGTPICDASVCKVVTCNAGFANCDNDALSCETNTTTDAKNCGSCGKACNVGETCVGSICSSLPASCRLVNGLKWCTNPNNTKALNCNLTCGSVGLTPIPDNTLWYNAQDTVAECQELRDAFGLGQPISIASYTYACAEVTGGNFLCSNFTGCPQEHRVNSDSGDHQGYCPCQ